MIERSVSENEIAMTAVAMIRDHRHDGALRVVEGRAQAAQMAGNHAMHHVWLRVQAALRSLIRRQGLQAAGRRGTP